VERGGKWRAKEEMKGWEKEGRGTCSTNGKNRYSPSAYIVDHIIQKAGILNLRFAVQKLAQENMFWKSVLR